MSMQQQREIVELQARVHLLEKDVQALLLAVRGLNECQVERKTLTLPKKANG